ncbi:MAG: hypothetical protein EOP04_07070, partial [Proteobacteria bacterium]
MENVKLPAQSLSVPSVEAMNIEMIARIEGIVTAFMQMHKSTSILASYGLRTKSLSSYDLAGYINEGLQNFFTKICNEVSVIFAKGTGAVCEFKQEWLAGISRHYDIFKGRNDDLETIDAIEIAAFCKDKINLGKIRDELLRDCFALKSKGLTDKADKISRFFSMVPKSYGRQWPHLKKDIIVCPTSSATNNSYSYNKTFFEIDEALRVASQITGFDLGNSSHELTAEIKNLSYNRPAVESRTTFGKGTNLQIVCFNDKYEYRFTKNAFSALIAFVLEHAS